jgi:hypothetical protein
MDRLLEIIMVLRLPLLLVLLALRMVAAVGQERRVGIRSRVYRLDLG